MKRALYSFLAVSALATVVLSSSPAGANPECLGSACGRPTEAKAPSAPLDDAWHRILAALASVFAGK